MKKHGLPAILVLLALLAGTVCPVRAEQPPETGSIVTFGRYEQDGNEENGPEPIEWTVLDVDGNAYFRAADRVFRLNARNGETGWVYRTEGD